jgi:ATP-dependent DNA helicase RecG
VRISIYPNRLEISNKGGLYGSAPLEALGRVDIGKRNPLIVDIMEILGKTENRNSGIATILAECESNGLPPPEFSSRHGEFKVVFRNRRPADEVMFDRKNIAATILAFCEVPRTRDELTRFTGRTQSYTMAYLVRPLLEDGRLVRTNPSALKDPNQRFVRNTAKDK